MTGAACLQVVISPAIRVAGDFDVLNAVGKVTGAFLESRWSWPRKFTAVSKVSYLLADPRTLELDPHEIKQLAAELRLRLFGAGDTGDVTLAMFQGLNEDVSRFARLPMETLRRILNGAGLETLGLRGRLLKIKPHSVEVLLDEAPLGDLDIMDDDQDDALNETRLLYRGIYLAPKQQFIGNIASRWNPSDRRLQTVLEGPTHYPTDPEAFDRETLETLLKDYPDPAKMSGYILLPMSYFALSKTIIRERYANFLAPLANWPKERLTALLYDAPRTMQHHALNDIRIMLNAHFGSVNLCVADAGIDLELLEQGALRSISLMLSSADEEVQREAAIKRFMKNRDLFREKNVWPMIGNIRTRHELRTCLAANAPFLYGPAVTEILEAPVAMAPFPADAFPVTGKTA
jgi:hypothetical protein